MQINTGALPGATLALATSKPIAQAWQVGQVLQAMVVGPAANGRVTLQVSGTHLEAQTSLPLRPGQRLTVSVEHAANQTVLRVIQPPANATTEVRADALRNVLPRQAPLPPLLSNLQHLAGQAPGQADRLPLEWVRQARHILQVLPRADTIARPEALRKALLESGLFLEARLASVLTRDHTFPQADLKAALLRLAALLTSGSAVPAKALTGGGHEAQPPLPGSPPRPQGSPPPTLAQTPSLDKAASELRAQVEGGLSRIQLNQLNSLSAEDGLRPAWLLELPIRQGEKTDLWSLRIEERDPGRQGAAGKAWSVSLAFALEPLGPIHARIGLRDDQVSAHIWAEQADTAVLVQRHLQDLQQRLADRGLGVGALNCHHGTPAQGGPRPVATAILDVKA